MKGTCRAICEKRFWFVSWALFLGVNITESKMDHTVLKLNLNQEIEEAIAMRKRSFVTSLPVHDYIFLISFFGCVYASL